MTKWHEHATLLLRKAAQDQYVLEKMLDDPLAPVEIFGFHAQQAAEKLLKAVLVLARRPYPRTHRLTELIDLIRQSGITLPERFEELRILSPFAVEFRYDILPEEPESRLDKPSALGIVRELSAFVESMLTNVQDHDEYPESANDEA